jgi:hypothetical protein
MKNLKNPCTYLLTIGGYQLYNNPLDNIETNLATIQTHIFATQPGGWIPTKPDSIETNKENQQEIRH